MADKLEKTLEKTSVQDVLKKNILANANLR